MIGMMQGRLLPMIDNKIQAFPGEEWRNEFQILQEIGYECIELTIDQKSWGIHPILSLGQEIEEIVEDTGIKVIGVCCDVFMENPFFSTSNNEVIQNKKMLQHLIDGCSRHSIGMVELPLLGKNSLLVNGKLSIDRVRQLNGIIKDIWDEVSDQKIMLALEADLGPKDFISVIEEYDDRIVGINYDTGNSTFFGFDPEEELNIYFKYIKNVHLKDCKRKEYSVPLGEGETNFKKISSLLEKYGYRGNFIMQAARQKDHIKAGIDYLNFFKSHFIY
jgi:L-ribulose-5-phosphate 3-epimerase